MSHRVRKTISFILCFLLFFQQSGFTQAVGALNLSAYFSQVQQGFSLDKFRPIHLRYLSYDSAANNFRLLIDKGDFFKGKEQRAGGKGQEDTSLSLQASSLSSLRGATPSEARGSDEAILNNTQTEELEQETKELLKYFFIGISLPNDAFWVNLRPDGQDNIIDPFLEKTDIGKILLEADVQLKKDTALATSPQTPAGKQYWDKLYKKAEELFGSENVNIPTLTRPWIVPNEIILREAKDNAYIYKATLKVMLEEDYLTKDEKTNHHPLSTIHNPSSSIYQFNDPRLRDLNKYASELLRELIIPKLTKDVNTAKRYAPLRQVYYSLILAQWFKVRFRSQRTEGRGQKIEQFNTYTQLIDSRNLANLTSKEPWSKATYFQQYQKSFQQGEYNITEQVYKGAGQSIRTYMSGGVELAFNEVPLQPTVDNPMTTSALSHKYLTM